jgi:hypothetical protein
MLKGIHLTVLIGPGVPVPAPQSVMEALTAVQVTSGKDRSGFQMTFGVSKRSLINTTLLPAGYFDPMSTRVIIIATLRGRPNVLMDGIITRQEVAPSNDPGHSQLTVTGDDLSVAMDVLELPKAFPGMSTSMQVNAVLAPYGALGVVPAVIPPLIEPVRSPTQRFDSQVVSDLAYVRALAQQAGYVFYVEPGPLPGQSIGYFGPDIRIPDLQPTLNVDMDAASNVETLSFSLDGLAKKVRVYVIMDPITRKISIPIPVPNVSLFKPPLGLRPTAPAKVELACKGANLQPDEAAKEILGFLMNNPNAITGTGTLDVLRYGNILRSRRVVGVRGAGLAYDGLYYVDSVTHSIKRGEYKQNFTLSRDGLISNTPRLPP